MPNLNKPFGLRPKKYLNGAPWNGQANLYFVHPSNTNVIFVGDLVIYDTTNGGSGATTQFPGQPAIAKYVAGTARTRGVVVGFLPEPDFSQNADVSYARKYRLASTARWALVVDDPMVLFEVQEVNSGTPLTVAEIGLNVEITNSGATTGGNTSTGMSSMVIDNTNEATTATLPLRLVASVLAEDNDFGFAAQRWLVKLNTSELMTATGI